MNTVQTLQKIYPNETICLAVIKDVPICGKDVFDISVDNELSKSVYSSEMVLKMLNALKQTRGLDNVVVTLMPRASKETWHIIEGMFGKDNIWAFTQNIGAIDEWEDKKCEFYKSMVGENSVIRIPISKSISGTQIREAIKNGDFKSLKKLVPAEIVDCLKEVDI